MTTVNQGPTLPVTEGVFISKAKNDAYLECVRLVKIIHEVTAAKDGRGEPEIGGDFKIAVEFLLSIEDQLADALKAVKGT